MSSGGLVTPSSCIAINGFSSGFITLGLAGQGRVIFLILGIVDLGAYVGSTRGFLTGWVVFGRRWLDRWVGEVVTYLEFLKGIR